MTRAQRSITDVCLFLALEKGMNPLFRGGAVALAPKPTD